MYNENKDKNINSVFILSPKPVDEVLYTGYTRNGPLTAYPVVSHLKGEFSSLCKIHFVQHVQI